MDARFDRRLKSLALAFVLSVSASLAMADLRVKLLGFDDLSGWSEDDHAAAFSVFQSTCQDMKDLDWQALCSAASDQTDAKSFFELFFKPVLFETDQTGLFTGYFEPELNGSLTPSPQFAHPVYALPEEAKRQKQWLSRRELLESGVLENRGLEIAWVGDPVELFFLQIQGSGRIRLPDGQTIRVGYAGKNGHPYRSIGRELVRRGVYEAHQVSAQVIKSWVRRNPEEGKELLYHNESYVFFREVSHVPAELGPLGAMNRSITAMRSIAIDPDYVPLGAPVWIEKQGEKPLNRLMVAQDTGSAIKGAQRADIFFGTGDVAGRLAGQVRDPGRLLVLLPIQRAYALAEGSRL